MARSITIRRSLLVSLALMILLTSAAVLVVTLISASHTAEDLSRDVIERTGDRTSSELERFFGPVRTNVEVAREWGEAGLIGISELDRAGRDDAADVGNLNRLFMPVLQGFPQMSSSLVAHTSGTEYLLLRAGNVWKNRITRVAEWGVRTFWMEWSGVDALAGTSWLDKDYDPRKRPWFAGGLDATAASGPHWTEPYVFFTTKDPGITASSQFRHPSREGTHVVAFDVLLTDISSFTSQLAVSEGGKVVVLTDDAKVIGLPRDQRFTTAAQLKGAVLSKANALEVPSLAAAVDRWQRSSRTTEPFAFTAGGRDWWAGFRPYTLGNRTLWIAVLVPEDDFLAGVKRQRNYIVGITLAALVVAIALAVFLARRYAAPLEALASQSTRIRNLELEPGAPIRSRITEVRALAEAQEQMRSALDSFARYVPIDVVRQLLEQGEVAQIGGRTRDLTVLFTDIRGFTTIAEGMEPAALTEHMAEYFGGLLPILHDEQATVDKFVGDAIVAFWGAPTPDTSHAHHAVSAVLRCCVRLSELNRAWQERGLPALPTCFGIGTGEVVVGNIGARTRLSYTVLGDTVNLASRVEALNRVYGTDALATRAVVEATGDAFVWRLVDRVAVKGKNRGARLYEPLGITGEVDDERLAWARAYEAAFAHYQERRFAETIEALAELGDDASVERLRAYCLAYQSHPPPEDWDGVARMTTK